MSFFGFLEELLPFKTKISDVENKKFEQEPLLPEKEPDTKLVDINGSISYLGLYDEDFTSVVELINTYREMASNYEVSEALDEIENEAVIIENDDSIHLNLDKITGISQTVKDKMSKEFSNILNLFEWNFQGHFLFRKWFVDGRLYVQKVMSKNVKEGIEKLIILDPKKIQRMKRKDTGEVYFRYEYNDVEKKVFQIPKDAIAYIPSGILDASHSFYISELHKSIRPLNNLRLIEDSALIYYITRAPMKRAFYVDAGQTSPAKAEEKLKKMMQKFRNRIAYDSTSGKIIQQKKSIPVNEDFWFLTRGDVRGTKIETLKGDTNLLDPQILTYYKKKFYKSMGVPYARVDDDSNSTVSFSSNTDVDRQELKFAKQTQKRRRRFSKLFDDILKTQLIAKKIIVAEDWEKYIKHYIMYVWKDDSHYIAAKEQEILKSQIDLADQLQAYVGKGKYFSNNYVRKNIFMQTDKDMQLMDKEIEEEEKSGKYGSEVDPTLDSLGI